jgi:hypothetical protein
MFCFCAQYTFLIYRLECVLFLCIVHISDIPPGICSVFCTPYPFLLYRLESVLFLCTVHISDIPSVKGSVSVHCTRFWCTACRMSCFCAQYISDAQLYDIYWNNRCLVQFSVASPTRCNVTALHTADSSNPCLTCNKLLVPLWKCPIWNLQLPSALNIGEWRSWLKVLGLV